jgi:capsular polysaccharide biosynthesis protein
MDNSGGGGNVGGALGGLGGLASLAGVSIPASPVEAVIAIATSDAFLIEFIRKHELKKILMKGAWDEESQQWRKPSGLVYTLWGQGLRPILMGERPKVNSPYPLAENEPTWQSMVTQSNMFSVQQDKKSNMITMSITWTDPNQAAQWVELWVNDLNDLIRERTIAESQSMLDNLIPKLDQPMPAEVRTSIISMIDEQTKTINAAMVKKDYALKMIDPPLAPETVAKPKRVLILAVAIVLGLMIGAMVAIIRGSKRKSSTIVVPEGLQRERV